MELKSRIPTDEFGTEGQHWRVLVELSSPDESTTSRPTSTLPISGLVQVEREHILRALEASNWSSAVGTVQPSASASSGRYFPRRDPSAAEIATNTRHCWASVTPSSVLHEIPGSAHLAILRERRNNSSPQPRLGLGGAVGVPFALPGRDVFE